MPNIHRCKGFTLIEAAITTAIAGVILVSLWFAVQAVYKSLVISRTIENTIAITENVRTLYDGHNRMTKAVGTDLTSEMVQAEVFPPDMLGDGLFPPKTIWKTDVRLYVGPTQDSFRIEFAPAIPDDNCQAFLARFVGTGRDPGLVALVAGGATFSGVALQTANPTNIPPCESGSLTFKLKS